MAAMRLFLSLCRLDSESTSNFLLSATGVCFSLCHMSHHDLSHYYHFVLLAARSKRSLIVSKYCHDPESHQPPHSNHCRNSLSLRLVRGARRCGERQMEHSTRQPTYLPPRLSISGFATATRGAWGSSGARPGVARPLHAFFIPSLALPEAPSCLCVVCADVIEAGIKVYHRNDQRVRSSCFFSASHRVIGCPA